jgi:hypothetical protein
MELKDYILMQIEGLKRGSGRAIDSLTQAELGWRPACGCNSIGLILFHIAKSEDSFIQTRLSNKAEIYETGKWAQKLNLAKDEPGAHYSADQVNCFAVPPLKDLLAYQDEVRANTLEYVKGMTAADFDKKVTMPHFGEMSVAAIFSIIVSHTSQHVGEISYLRGLQRGMDK